MRENFPPPNKTRHLNVSFPAKDCQRSSLILFFCCRVAKRLSDTSYQLWRASTRFLLAEEASISLACSALRKPFFFPIAFPIHTANLHPSTPFQTLYCMYVQFIQNLFFPDFIYPFANRTSQLP